MVWEGGGWSGVGEVNDSGADLDIFRLRAVYVSLLANIGVLYQIFKQKSKKNAKVAEKTPA